MTIYAVGDLQGCFTELEQLLETVQFDPNHDHLWLAGDLVNRGPQSLEVLRFAYSLGDRVKVVLGNHDLHLLAVAYAGAKVKRQDTLDAILKAPDRDELLNWLRYQPLCHFDEAQGYVMTHAGIPPIWSVADTLAYAHEVEAVLRSHSCKAFFNAMYGNKPDIWSDELVGFERLRVITNYLTRMRFCTAEGQLEFESKEGLDQCPVGFAPWFSFPRKDQAKVIFGHWAALEGKIEAVNCYALDTGCVWGGSLTALNLSNAELSSVPSLQKSLY
ncbi:Bis(5'nucleosyl)-tetraphosphatase, ApaH [Oceanospirillum multiglobuliferum]|uniref:Bis(5'-nucleosyl)-tetraphosphatase, symmetrical n=1 Tax=Oceanospirillum multiglobuliferum TaxID=64969 RepID=A0A1T4Q127_9GAMM|nr:symmetrical bis(5'-nucleosyl)-tetraphosphatase [Oceanospirillum multiglobuliferum]OPX55470.1 bis(5'-nucleosyl)-tetraphosphatase (symmetrical) [Oceanospirillum multiglobuliferum]SJZ97515.1 Bis(5'nucleosyl)-tetraphosphatase, ApaH [Oceanospirillum multiglobuliferum]